MQQQKRTDSKNQIRLDPDNCHFAHVPDGSTNMKPELAGKFRGNAAVESGEQIVNLYDNLKDEEHDDMFDYFKVENQHRGLEAVYSGEELAEKLGVIILIVMFFGDI